MARSHASLIGLSMTSDPTTVNRGTPRSARQRRIRSVANSASSVMIRTMCDGCTACALLLGSSQLLAFLDQGHETLGGCRQIDGGINVPGFLSLRHADFHFRSLSPCDL